MTKRNIIWILVIVLLGLIFWYAPDIATRKQTIEQQFVPLLEVYATIKKNYVEPVKDKELVDGAIEGMIRQLDPFCRYIRPEELKTFDQQMSGVIHGIGIFIELRDGFPTVISPLEGSPAFKAGILAGDRIIKINGVSTKSMNIYEVARLLSGPVGTTVTLEVKHEITDTVETVKVVRGVIQIKTIRGFARKEDNGWDFFIEPEKKIAYLRITGFLANTHNELDEVYLKLLRDGMRGLIIDLRWTPGGLLQSAVNVADRFLADGVIVSTKGRWKQEFTWKATKGNEYKLVPMVILVNQYTASAAEILSGALQYYKKVVLLGERTFGKGCVQTIIPLRENFGAVKLTTAYYYLANGRNIQRRPGKEVWGVDPDIKVTLSRDEQIEVLKSRRKIDTVTKEVQENVGSRKIYIDTQLAEAISVLSKKLTTQPTTKLANE